MSESIRILLLLLCFAALFVKEGSCEWNKTCAALIKKSDLCLRHAILIGREELNIPRTVEDIDLMICNSLGEDIKCINRIRPCLRPFPRTVFNVAMRSIQGAIKRQYCGTVRGKQTIVDSLICVKHDDDARRLFNILDKITAVTDFIANDAPVEMLLPHLCCAIFKGLDDSKVIMDTVCKGDALSDTFLKVMASMFGDVLDLGCGRYDSVALCNEKLPMVMTNVTTVWERTTIRYPHSPIIPLLTLLNRLDAPI